MRYSIQHTNPESGAYEDNTPILYYIYDNEEFRRVSGYVKHYYDAETLLKEWNERLIKSIKKENLLTLEEIFDLVCQTICKWPDENINNQSELFEKHCKNCKLKEYLVK